MAQKLTHPETTYPHVKNLPIVDAPEKKKVIRTFWINVYPHHNAMSVFTTSRQADENASPDRIECIQVKEQFSTHKVGI